MFQRHSYNSKNYFILTNVPEDTIKIPQASRSTREGFRNRTQTAQQLSFANFATLIIFVIADVFAFVK
jgi:hypothetical protein